MAPKNRRRQLLVDLSKTWVVQRLRHINLSAVPSWLCPSVSTAFRYRHSIGVGQLSLLVPDGTEHEQLLLTASGVLHDVGTGPFPHISDPIMKELLGFTHEGGVRFAFTDSPLKDSLVLEKYGLDLQEVSSVLDMKHHLSSFLSGFPDLDNADNVYRFLTTIPGKLLGEPSYHPSEVGASMSLESKKQTLPDDLFQRWRKDRETVYSHLWSDTLNMIGWTMLGRALRLLKENLTPRFFRMSNREAFRLIRLNLSELAKGLTTQKFRLLIDRKYTQFRGEARKFVDQSRLEEIEDKICNETGLDDWSIGITVDHQSSNDQKDFWRIYLVSYKGNDKPKTLLDDMLSNSLLQ